MKTISAVMDVTVQTEVQIIEIKKGLTGTLSVLLEVEGKRSWHRAGDKTVVTLTSRMDRNG